jgi:hypothetical protein
VLVTPERRAVVVPESVVVVSGEIQDVVGELVRGAKIPRLAQLSASEDSTTGRRSSLPT